jgi:hypothetical protein
MAAPLARRPEADGASPQAVPAGSGTAGYGTSQLARHLRAAAETIELADLNLCQER